MESSIYLWCYSLWPVSRVNIFPAQAHPFSIQLRKAEANSSADASQPNNEQLLSLLPASYRTGSDNVASPSLLVITCIEKELDLQRLNMVFGWLWVASRRMPPRPLHCQLLLSQAILSRSKWICILSGRRAEYSSSRSRASCLSDISGPFISPAHKITSTLRRKSAPERASGNANVEGFGSVRSGSCFPIPR